MDRNQFEFSLGRPSEHRKGRWLEGRVVAEQETVQFLFDFCERIDEQTFAHCRVEIEVGAKFSAKMFLSALDEVCCPTLGPTENCFALFAIDEIDTGLLEELTSCLDPISRSSHPSYRFNEDTSQKLKRRMVEARKHRMLQKAILTVPSPDNRSEGKTTWVSRDRLSTIDNPDTDRTRARGRNTEKH